MKKAELIKLHEQGKLKVKGSASITNVASIHILYVDHYSLDNKVFGFVVVGEKKYYFYVKLYYGVTAYFRVKGVKYQLDEFIAY